MMSSLKHSLLGVYKIIWRNQSISTMPCGCRYTQQLLYRVFSLHCTQSYSMNDECMYIKNMYIYIHMQIDLNLKNMNKEYIIDPNNMNQESELVLNSNIIQWIPYVSCGRNQKISPINLASWPVSKSKWLKRILPASSLQTSKGAVQHPAWRTPNKHFEAHEKPLLIRAKRQEMLGETTELFATVLKWPTTNCLLECMNWVILSFPEDVRDVNNATSTQNLNS